MQLLTESAPQSENLAVLLDCSPGEPKRLTIESGMGISSRPIRHRPSGVTRRRRSGLSVTGQEHNSHNESQHRE